MQKFDFRPLCATALAGVASFLALGSSMVPAPSSAAAARPAGADVSGLTPPVNGQLDFVVSGMTYAMGPDGNSTSCPNGLTSIAAAPGRAGGADQAAPAGNSAGGARPTAAGEAGAARAALAGEAGAPGRGGQGSRGGAAANNVCQSPELAAADPHFRTMVGSNIVADGLDLDGQVSTLAGKAARGTCVHDDFQGKDGMRGVDNQFYRVLGCTAGFQSTGGHRGFATEMLTGAWGVLISIKGIDSLVNDPNVEVGIYANNDPIQLSASRQALAYASYTPQQDSRFLARTRGRIVNGVLTTNPVDVRFHHTVNAMRLERPIDAARLRLSFQKDGSVEGLLGGYTRVDDIYNVLVGFRNGKDGKGQLSAARFHSSLGAARSAGMTCNGLYHALKQLADGEFDPKTGKCNAISHQYRLKAVPAFIVPDAPSQIATTTIRSAQ